VVSVMLLLVFRLVVLLKITSSSDVVDEFSFPVVAVVFCCVCKLLLMLFVGATAPLTNLNFEGGAVVVIDVVEDNTSGFK